MFCPNCGNKVTDRDAFCDKCGARIITDDMGDLGNMDETVTQVGVPEYGQPGYGGPEEWSQDYRQPQYGAPGYGAPGYGSPEYGYSDYGGPEGWDQPPGPRQSKQFPIIIIGVIVFVLIVAGLVTWLLLGGYFHSDSDDDDTAATTETQEMTTEDSYSSDDDYDSTTEATTTTEPREESVGSGHEDDIIPYSSDRLLTEEDLYGLTSTQIQYAIDEIYARHGAEFKDKDVVRYFSSKSWYYPSKSQTEAHSEFSTIESKNVDFMKEYSKYL